MGWFGRKSAGAAARPPFVPSWLGTAEDAGFVRSYDAQYDEVFRNNPVGQRSVRLVAGMVSALTVEVAEGDPRAAKLVTADGLLEGIAASLLLHGNAFVKLIAGPDDAPVELCLLRPERVSIATDSQGYPAAYLYRVGNRTVRTAARDALARRQLGHVRALNPGDDHYGLGCLNAAIAAASVHNRATRWNKALLDNAARPSGALVYEPGDGSGLSVEQFDRLRDEMAEQFSGSANAGRPLLLEGGLKWQALSLSPADMDFAALKDGAARDIALAFGVPPVLVGLPGDATYANAREAGRALYRQTVLPMAEIILRELATLLGDWLGPVRFAVDTDQLTELAEDRARLWAQLSAAEFLTRAEKRDMLGFSPEQKEKTP